MRKKTTVYLEPDLLRAAKVWAARTGRKDYEILNDYEEIISSRKLSWPS